MTRDEIIEECARACDAVEHGHRERARRRLARNAHTDNEMANGASQAAAAVRRLKVDEADCFACEIQTRWGGFHGHQHTCGGREVTDRLCATTGARCPDECPCAHHSRAAEMGRRALLEREIADYLRRLQEAHEERDKLRAALTSVTYADGAGPDFDWDAYFTDTLAAAKEALARPEAE